MKYYKIFFSFIGLLYCQQSFEDYKNQQNQSFQSYKNSITKKYKKFEAAEREAFNKFKTDVELKWQNFKSSSNKVYVSYDKDLQSRASIDFDKGDLSIGKLNDSVEKFGIKTEPWTFLINTEGKIKNRYQGFVESKELKTDLESIIEY